MHEEIGKIKIAFYARRQRWLNGERSYLEAPGGGKFDFEERKPIP
jgi:hypothetical protein